MGALRSLLITSRRLRIAAAPGEQGQTQERLFVVRVQINGSLKRLFGLLVRSRRLKHRAQ
jgi:hypothetical protein